VVVVASLVRVSKARAPHHLTHHHPILPNDETTVQSTMAAPMKILALFFFLGLVKHVHYESLCSERTRTHGMLPEWRELLFLFYEVRRPAVRRARYSASSRSEQE
jgi:hypothetical protein